MKDEQIIQWSPEVKFACVIMPPNSPLVPGWYFENEEDETHGPFGSIGEALEARRDYLGLEGEALQEKNLLKNSSRISLEKIKEEMRNDETAVFCSSCRSKLFRFYKLVPPSPISEWDKENSNFRKKCLFCCGKIRMRDDNDDMVSFDVPENARIIGENEN